MSSKFEASEAQQKLAIRLEGNPLATGGIGLIREADGWALQVNLYAEAGADGSGFPEEIDGVAVTTKVVGQNRTLPVFPRE